jgi:hypothetical protein
MWYRFVMMRSLSLAFLTLCIPCGVYAQKNKAPAIPENILNEQCLNVIHSNKQLAAYAGAEVYNVIPIFSKDGIDVYTVERDFNDAIDMKEFNGSFVTTLYFVFRDEEVRQKAIQSISEYNPQQSSKSCSVPVNSASGTNWKRNQDCSDLYGTAEGKTNKLKYVAMSVGYYPIILNPQITRPNGQTIFGPILEVFQSDYIAPMMCIGSLPFRAEQNRFPDIELILDNRRDMSAPTVIGAERGFIEECGSCPRWSLFTGDLSPLRDPELGFSFIHLDKQRTPFLLEVVETMRKKIAESRKR